MFPPVGQLEFVMFLLFPWKWFLLSPFRSAFDFINIRKENYKQLAMNPSHRIGKLKRCQQTLVARKGVGD